MLGDRIDFVCVPVANLPAIYADAGMIEQVLVNLSLNARDAMPHGGSLTLGAAPRVLAPAVAAVNPEARPGHFVCLSVADTGVGMDHNTLSHLFEPFFTTKEVGKGAGLGLATVYGIVKQHQGWITVESKPGAGSTFNLFFPAVPRPAAAVAPQSQPQLPAATGSETLLVVEDEPSLRELVVRVLQLCGYRIYEAANGVEALQVWARHKDDIDLLLTDMVMPEGLSGRQLAERLQKEDPALKVIYTSGYSPGMAGKDIALLEGFNFLAKPYPPSRLAQVVRECLDGKQELAQKSLILSASSAAG